VYRQQLGARCSVAILAFHAVTIKIRIIRCARNAVPRQIAAIPERVIRDPRLYELDFDGVML
jgi:hypothetical protein